MQNKRENNTPGSLGKKIVFPAPIAKQYFLRKIKKEKKLLLFSLLAIAVISVLGASVNLFSLRIDDSRIIKDVSVSRSNIVAGQPVKWTVLVQRSLIKEGQTLIQLPKTAKNITVKKVSAAQALVQQSNKAFTNQDRQVLAGITPSATPTVKPKGIFAKLTSFLFASVDSAVEQIAETITEAITETKDQDVIQAGDAIFIDLSEEILPAPSEQPESEQKVKKDKDKEEKEKEKEGAEAEEPPQETDVPLVEEPTEEPLVEEPTEEPLVEEPIEEPLVEEPTEEPLVEEPTEEPLVEEPIEEPLVEEPTEEPLVEEPIEEPPVVEPEYVVVEYETPAPEITEQETDNGKLVTVSSSDESSKVPLIDVLAYTNIPEIFKVGDEAKIKIKWQNNKNQDVRFSAYDLNNNGKLDYVEWTVPHLSEQIFEIIFISKAFKLDENREIIEDIYDIVSEQDDIWASISDNQYVRVTFQQILISQNDITMHAKPTNPGESVRVEVYPENSDELITVFNNINQEKTYKVLLTNLSSPTDVFDLKVMGQLDIDYIVDPTPPSGAPSVTEPVNSSSIGNLQTIIGTPAALTQSTSTLFNYLRLLEERIGTTASAETEDATDEGKLEDLLGASATDADRTTIFNYIHKIYTALVNLIEGNIKSGIVIGGLTGTYSGVTYTWTKAGSGSWVGLNENLDWVKEIGAAAWWSSRTYTYCAAATDCTTTSDNATLKASASYTGPPGGWNGSNNTTSFNRTALQNYTVIAADSTDLGDCSADKGDLAFPDGSVWDKSAANSYSTVVAGCDVDDINAAAIWLAASGGAVKQYGYANNAPSALSIADAWDGIKDLTSGINNIHPYDNDGVMDDYYDIPSTSWYSAGGTSRLPMILEYEKARQGTVGGGTSLLFGTNAWTASLYIWSAEPYPGSTGSARSFYPSSGYASSNGVSYQDDPLWVVVAQ